MVIDSTLRTRHALPLRVSLAIAFSSVFYAGAATAAKPDATDFVRGRLLIEVKSGLSPDTLTKLIGPYGGKARKIGQSNLHIVDLPQNASEMAVLKQIEHRPEFEHVELDRLVKSSMAVNDPYIGSQWHVNKIGLPAAWDVASGAGVTIAILDSGVDAFHPDLKPNLIAGRNIFDGNSDVSDICGHGTSVAGAAAAAMNNAIGVAGAAGTAKVMPLRIAYWNSVESSCYATYSTIASGITYAADNGAKIANVSYARLAASSSILSAARYMKSKGGLVFVSAGNANIDEKIVADPALVVVASTTGTDARSSFSSYGEAVSLSAPGSGIWTTGVGGTYRSASGTSFSSPIAAGVAALMMSARPDLSAEVIQSLLYKTAVDLGSAGRDIYFGYGRVDAAGAVAAAKSYEVVVDTKAPTAAITAPLGSSTVSGLVDINVSAVDNVGVSRVELKANGTVVAIDTAAPFSFSWNSTGAVNGMNKLVAVAYDAAENAGESPVVEVNVANNVSNPVVDVVPPEVTFVNPVAGNVSGKVTVNVTATDNAGAAGVSMDLYIGTVKRAYGTGGSLSYSWNTKKAAGPQTLRINARDRAGNETVKYLQVTVVK